jgi:hypothetical protein
VASTAWGASPSCRHEAAHAPFEKKSVGLLRGITGDDYLVPRGSGYLTVADDNVALTFVSVTFPVSGVPCDYLVAPTPPRL